MTERALAVRRGRARFEADPARVIARMFVAGQERFDNGDSRATGVVARVLALTEDEVERALADVVARFHGRHRNLLDIFRRHAEGVSDRLDPGADTSEDRLLLIGATFTSEYAIEGAAVCNPSIVAHPDQSDVAEGALRFVMGVRSIGEGHRSSIGFRTGTVDRNGDVAVEPAPAYAVTAHRADAPMPSVVFRAELERLGELNENAAYVLDPLGESFAKSDLEARLAELLRRRRTRAGAERTIAAMSAIADRSYGAVFGDDTALTERVLWPSARAESHGMEDARFLRFTHTGGETTYYAPYTAYDGSHVTQQLLATDDFLSFTSSPLVGPAAANKGLALFPRQIGGRYAALSRCDRETNSIAFSDNLHEWPASTPLQTPARWWELLQLGNCGAPIETPEGWLVLTHGVGPMRTYSIGALLLDLHDPSTVIGALEEPLLAPSADEREGYVPNVVYSCGALVHGDHLVVPYGVSDGAVAVATASLTEVLAALAGTVGR